MTSMKNALGGEKLELEDVEFMCFSLLDDGKVIVEGDNKTPCNEVYLEEQSSFDQPLAWLCRSSPHIPYKDYTLNLEVKEPRCENCYADLPIVVRYNP